MGEVWQSFLFHFPGQPNFTQKKCLTALGEGARAPRHSGAANSLGQVYFAQGRPKDAERLYVQVLAGVRKSLGNDRSETLDAVNNLGLLYQTQGRLAEAEPLLREAMEGTIRVLGPEHPDTLIATQNLAELYFLRDKLADGAAAF